jgi:ankyrin repeat protein
VKRRSPRPDTADTGPFEEVDVVDLQQLRKQAKDLVRAARQGDPAALSRLGGREVKLAGAQLVVAREQGYASWPALVVAAEAGAGAVVLAATGGREERARAMLAARPELARDPWVRLVLGERWEGDVRAPGGPRGWPPLVYVAHSALAGVDALEDLLRRGADPNDRGSGDYGPVSALYGASGVVRDPARTRALLDAGADPDDNDSLYHAAESADTTCLRMLLEHGARTAGTHALAHALDYEALEPVRMLLDAGADAGEGALVAHAVRRGRGPEVIELLAAHGADLDRPGGETWRGDVPLRTPYQHAVLRARDDVADTLRRLGADATVSEDDLGVAALARGEAPPGGLPAALDVDQQEVVILAALGGHVDAVVDALGAGFTGVVGGSPVGTLLHHAGWVGSPAVAAALLDRGADPLARVDVDLPTPLGWTAAGSVHHRLPGRDYVAVAELLIAAGDTVTPALVDAADGPLHDWLAERG